MPEASKTTEQTVTLHSYGDQELWYAQAQDSTWRLPLIVEWRHDKDNDRHYALVSPAVGLYINQSLALQALFQFHDVMGSKERWLIPRNICEAILHKAPGITPNRYYYWPDDICPPLPTGWNEMKSKGFKYPVNKDEEQVLNGQPFIKHIATSSSVPASVVSIVFKTICREAPKWMLDNKQPLELGFCQLVAMPFRANWKEIIAFKCKGWKLRRLFSESKTDEDLHQKLADLKMPSVMCSPQNIGLVKGRLQHTLEVIPTKRFEEAVYESEGRRLACGWNSYVAHFEESVEKYYHLMVRAMGNYIKKAAAPFARVHGGSVSGVVRFLPVGGKQALIHGIRVENIPVYCIPTDSNFSVTAEQSDQRLVQIQAPEVLKMSNLLPAPADLRKCNEQGEMVEQGPARTNGLSL